MRTQLLDDMLPEPSKMKAKSTGTGQLAVKKRKQHDQRLLDQNGRGMRDYHLVVLAFWMLSSVQNSVFFLRWAFTEKSGKVTAVLYFFSFSF